VSEGVSTTSLRDDTVSFHPVSGGAVLFNAVDGRLFALNPAAGMTWLCARDGLSPAESTLALTNAFKVEPAVATDWFRSSTQMFKDLGLLAGADREDAGAQRAARETPAAPVSRRLQPEQGADYRLFDQFVRVNAPAELQASIDSLMGYLRVDPSERRGDEHAVLQIDIFARGDVACGDAWDVVADGQLELSCEAASVVAEVERLVTQAVVPATPHLLTLHAAAVQRDGRTLLLTGPSGSGKTTLSVALAKAGWSFGSDEIVLLDRIFDLRPLPLPPCIKADNFPLIGTWFADLRNAPEHSRYGKTIKYLPIKPWPLVAGTVVVVFPRHDPDSAGHIQSLDTFSGLERLLAQCVFVPPGFRHDDVAQLLRWHDRLSYLEITYRDCDTALRLLRSIEVDKPESA
jgi:hypothetical protein